MAEVAIQKKETIWDEIQKMEERVMQRAYDIFRDNGSVAGTDLENWLAAERELMLKPAIELKERNKRFELQVAVPGMDAKDLKVEVTADGLLIKGESRTEKKEEKGAVHTSEFRSGSIFRSIQFPRKVDATKVKADLKNGVLTVVAPFEEEVKPGKAKAKNA